MAEEPDNIVLVMLRRMDTKLDRVIADLHDVKVRMTAMEEGLNGVQRRIDRVEDRLNHVERRLDLSGPTPGFSE
jgi:hypothetical protein